MEKVLYLLNAPEGITSDRLREQLVDDVAPRLLAAGAHRVQVNVMDSDVGAAAASRLRSGTGPCPDAMVSVWVDSANEPLRTAYDAVLGEEDAAFAAYLVTESAPLPGPPVVGRRPGYTQVSFLQRPGRLDEQAWLRHWQDHHTQVAIDTQATTRYLQNFAIRPLTPDAPPCTAVVEECLPAGAMTDPAVFFDVVPTSEYAVSRRPD